ncbi:type II secretion system F family protein [Thermoflexus sp.]|uniref:type II secretion system F family protein n=1 Tax=Thermoflexus sp. TaxID=1969742 RepID=UPI002ADE9571|nr:type II secretion system F family protein [Thermoflexus sp.]
MTALVALGPFLIALGAAFLAARAAHSLLPAPAPVRALERVREEREEAPDALRDLARAFGPLARLLPADRSLADDLRLVQAFGKLTAWRVEDLAAARAGLLLLGLAFLALGPRAIFIALPLAAAGYLFPRNHVAGEAEKIRRQLFRETPDAAETLAFLVSLGLPVDEALRRMAEGSSAFARLLRAGIAACPPGIPLAAHLAGWVRFVRVPALAQMFFRLSEIARKGVGDRTLMGDLAASAAAAYEAEILARAERLDATLTVPVGLFYFIPYLGLVLLPMAYAFLTSGLLR